MIGRAQNARNERLSERGLSWPTPLPANLPIREILHYDEIADACANFFSHTEPYLFSDVLGAEPYFFPSEPLLRESL